MSEIKLIAFGLALAGLLLWLTEAVRSHDRTITEAALAPVRLAASQADFENKAKTAAWEAARRNTDAETQRLAARSRAAADRLDKRAPGLLDAALASCRAMSANPGPVGVGASAADGAGVFTLVSGEIGTRLRALGKIAQDRGERGAGCVREHDQVAPP